MLSLPNISKEHFQENFAEGMLSLIYIYNIDSIDSISISISISIFYRFYIKSKRTLQGAKPPPPLPPIPRPPSAKQVKTLILFHPGSKITRFQITITSKRSEKSWIDTLSELSNFDSVLPLAQKSKPSNWCRNWTTELSYKSK